MRDPYASHPETQACNAGPRLALLRALLPPTIAVAHCDPLANPPPPFAEEDAGLSPNALDKRRREFAAGRAAAHQAMRALNRTPAPIPIGPKRAPLWPAGLSGSISHCRSAAMAAVARTRDHSAIGIDLEENSPLAPPLWAEICSPRERDWLSRQSDPGLLAKLIFSAKEAAYKAQYTLSHAFFGFDGMELEFDEITTGPAPGPTASATLSGAFDARFTCARPPFAADSRLRGRFAIGCGLIVTALHLPAANAAPHVEISDKTSEN